MIIRSARTQKLPTLQEAKVSFELTDGYLATRTKDGVTVTSPDGEVVHTAKGYNLDANDQGQALWMSKGNIHRWDPQIGVTKFEGEFDGMTPGPDGKTLALRYKRNMSEAAEEYLPYDEWPEPERQVVLLGTEGQELASRVVPDGGILGTYANHDGSELLIASHSFRSRIDYDSKYHYDNQVTMVQVQGNQLAAGTIDYSPKRSTESDEYAPILLDDGRLMLVEYDSVAVGNKDVESSKEMQDALGPAAAPGGRIVSLKTTLAPALTLAEQLAQAGRNVGFHRFDLGELPVFEGTPVWPLHPADETEAPSILPEPVNQVPEEKADRSSLFAGMTAALGTLGGGALALAGLTPVGIGVAAAGLLGAAVVKSRRSGHKGPSLIAPPSVDFNRRDPKVLEQLKEELILGDVVPQTFAKAQWISEGDRQLVFFEPTGMILTSVGTDNDRELSLYGPTGDQKQLEPIENFSLDPDSGVLKLDEAEYDLNTGEVESSWVSISDGVIQDVKAEKPGTIVTYDGAGKFSVGNLPIPPEVFSTSVEVPADTGSGKVVERKTVLHEESPGPVLIERIETLKNPELRENQMLSDFKPDRQKLEYRATLSDGRVLRGNMDGVTLNGKAIPGKLEATDDGVKIRTSVNDTYQGKVRKRGFGATLGNFINPDYRPTEEATRDFESHQITQEFRHNGEVVITRLARPERNPHSPYEVVDKILVQTDGNMKNLPIDGATRAEKPSLSDSKRVTTGVNSYAHFMSSYNFKLPVELSV